MIATLLLALFFAVPDSTGLYYARMDSTSLRAYCSHPADERENLRCRYRLYPLTWDESQLRELPRSPASEDAESYALLSGLWGYRASISRLPGGVRYGIRSERLLKRARQLDPGNLYVLLVEAQSLLFKPAIVGGDPRQAASRFEALAERLIGERDPPFEPIEALTWHWYALVMAGDDSAEAIRQRLLAGNPPPLFRAMLENPP